MKRRPGNRIEGAVSYPQSVQGDKSCRGHGLGWVDFDFGCYTVFPILLGQMGIWQNPLGNMVEHPI